MAEPSDQNTQAVQDIRIVQAQNVQAQDAQKTKEENEKHQPFLDYLSNM